MAEPRRPAPLASRTVGEEGPRVVFVHGLFGQGKNWATVARRLAEHPRRVTMLDLPDHGRSPRSEQVDYLAMADVLASELEALGEPVVLVGHSMGGKVAMQLALRRPELLRALVVVDIAPVEYPTTGGHTDDPGEEPTPFADYVRAMRALDLDALTSREDADAALAPAVPSTMVRGFLLQSLLREPGQGSGGPRWRWALNLPVLADGLETLRGFPDPPPGATYDGPVLWVAGATSTYVLDEDRPAMDTLFPRTQLLTVKDAGHWVHAEQPDVFTAALERFCARVEG
ncbi:alpha/beta fold hydrolase [Pseudokineococcus basanitobsidens]|uniref:Alpha/beta fold hydrolase n=1 Tax=Pseudokineococcus basanitobsidens TaxID=1926649 RepID=A0ABU8RMR2_9ACTN